MAVAVSRRQQDPQQGRQPQQRKKEPQERTVHGKTAEELLSLDTALDDAMNDARTAATNSRQIKQQQDRQEGREFVSDGSFLAGLDRARGGTGGDSAEIDDAVTPLVSSFEVEESMGTDLNPTGLENAGLQTNVENDIQLQAQLQLVQQNQLATNDVMAREREELAQEIEELQKWLSVSLARERYTREELMHIYACIMSMARIKLEELLSDSAQKDEMVTEEDYDPEHASGPAGFENDDDSDGSGGKRRRNPYKDNISTVPLMKKIMGRESVRFQKLWTVLDKHLDKQVEDEEVRENMFRFSF
jgi:hypothetical protein